MSKTTVASTSKRHDYTSVCRTESKLGRLWLLLHINKELNNNCFSVSANHCTRRASELEVKPFNPLHQLGTNDSPAETNSYSISFTLEQTNVHRCATMPEDKRLAFAV